jgi:uncharacterized protein (TIGR00299 family) protein
MRLLAIDPFHGAAGDMILGALLDLGVPQDPVIAVMASVVAEPGIEPVSKCGIRALQVHTHAGHSHRTLEEVLAIVRSAAAPREVITRACSIFTLLAGVEAEVHGKMTHFHEVGADDAIADILGSCMAFHLLGADRIEVLPVATGQGTVRMVHGELPVPAPATALLLRSGGLLVTPGTADGELCTPTGAALLSSFADAAVSRSGSGKILSIGYGAGTREDMDAPNVVRMILYETGEERSDEVDILETNVDDVSSEVIGHLLTRLIAEGARDASAAAIIMKKGRPGHLIRVITRPCDSARIAGIMAKELGTLGIRCIPAIHRFIAEREIAEVSVLLAGEEIVIPVKYGYDADGCYSVKAEFDSAAAAAIRLGIPVRDILREAEHAARRNMTRRDA